MFPTGGDVLPKLLHPDAVRVPLGTAAVHMNALGRMAQVKQPLLLLVQDLLTLFGRVLDAFLLTGGGGTPGA